MEDMVGAKPIAESDSVGAKTMSEAKAEYWFWRNRGRCVRCHCQDALTMNRRKFCGDCRDANNQYQREHRNNEASRTVMKEHYYRRKAEGKCVDCGKRPATGGAVRCQMCRNARKRRVAERYQRKSAESAANYPRGANGFCYTCNKRPAMQEKKLCAECYGKACASLGQVRPQRNEQWALENKLLLQG